MIKIKLKIKLKIMSSGRLVFSRKQNIEQLSGGAPVPNEYRLIAAGHGIKNVCQT